MSAAVANVSAAEVIEQIKKLPPDQIRLVHEFLQGALQEAKKPEVEYITREEVERSAQKFFTRYRELFEKLAK